MKVFLIEPENCSHDQNNAVAIFAESDIEAMLFIEKTNKTNWPIFEKDQWPMRITELNENNQTIILVSSNAG